MLLLVLLSLAGSVFSADGPEYRLAGIVAVGPDRLLAVIEMPDGRQGLFRAGDTLGEGRIKDITRGDVHVEMKGQTFLLSLRGNPKLNAASPIVDEDEQADEDSAEPSADATVRTQPLFYEDTVRLLTSVSRATANATPAGAAAEQGKGATAESLSAKLGELLGVPPGARIVAVDGASVQSPQEVIDKVVPLLGLGRAVRLNLADAGDLKVVYITPVEEN